MSAAGRGQHHAASTASHGLNKKEKKGKKNPINVDQTNTELIKNSVMNKNVAKLDIDSLNDSELSLGQPSLSDIQAHYDEKICLMEAKFEAKLEALYKVIQQKDDVIGKLNVEIGELKQGFNFISKETSEIKTSLSEASNTLNIKINENKNHFTEIKTKTIDLEDRSRRCNLVFFNFPEAARNEPEDCESLICGHLTSLGIFPPNDEIFVERAHRLGRRKPENSTKPQPIVVCFSYYKQKEFIIKNAACFRSSPVNVSEDYSRETLDEHRKLHQLGLHAKETFQDPTKAIKRFKVNYKRLTITYCLDKNNSSSPTFVKSFLLKDIVNTQNWFIPPERQQSSTQLNNNL